MINYPTSKDAAQPICQQGHVQDKQGRKFCPQCGQAVYAQCPACGHDIPGAHTIGSVFAASDKPAPDFCTDCGQPFPWRDAQTTP